MESLHLRSTTRMYLRMTLASLIAGAVAWALVWVVGTGANDSLVARAVTLALAVVVFLVIVLGVAHALRVREVAELLVPCSDESRVALGWPSHPHHLGCGRTRTMR